MIPLIYHPIYSQLALPSQHRYPINKYRLLYDAVKSEMAQNPSWANHFEFFQPQALSLDAVKRVHDSEYVDALARGELPAAKMRRIGFPWSERLIERTLTSAGGTCLSVELAAKHGVAIHLSGGYHHAHYDFGSGFCLFNDLVLAAHHALSFADVGRVLIVDSDVHQGDGTAALCAGRHEIITLSFHCDKNFPARKPNSTIDIALAKQTGSEEFLDQFANAVTTAIKLYLPDLIIYDAGVDIHQDDELGYLNVSRDALYQRDVLMLSLALDHGCPMACVIGGGYRQDHQSLVPLHMKLLEAAYAVYSPRD